ncbi:hypothetical protein [Couchioplanes caeruleus]|uniref:Uncharacterized protein n=2 Tax=Couchioplanes caeruleus TaxID=56438 RepID=A0A1K0FDD5_9ACTN|nr:hypothetical protein [Couchioplanes caeruleus]OJF10855.1 hypothetical protein BG844_29705 [Couchioplanes caeruleus subsp. caeruleus]ROP32807.1 hypothetical protein EDD30_5755 [Couchioplanes caeruleus]
MNGLKVARSRDTAAGVALAVAAIGVVAILVSDPTRPVDAGTELAAVTLVTAVVVCGGTGLGAVITLLSARTASTGEWLRRSAAGVALLSPAAIYVTWPFLAQGWDFDTCGTLIARNQSAFRYSPDFQQVCESAAQEQLLRAIVWAGVGCAAAVAYGLGLRRWRGVRASRPPGADS